MDSECFLRSSPRELGGLLDQLTERDRRRMVPAAMICSVIANVHRDSEQRSEPWTIQDFLPGAKSKEEEMIEWLEALEAGDEPEPDPEEVARFKQQMKAAFRNLQESTP
jgi:hypothetical protein